MRRLILAGAVLLIGACGTVEAQPVPKIYNTAKQKLLDGKQVVGGTVFSPEPANTATSGARTTVRPPMPT